MGQLVQGDLMVRLTVWQWLGLGFPIVVLVIFLVGVTAWQIHQWHLNWIWAVFTIVFLGWRWLLVRWTRPVNSMAQTLMSQVQQDLIQKRELTNPEADRLTDQVEHILDGVLASTATEELPIWEDWSGFWNQCQELVSKIAQVYHPEVSYPLLNIYIPDAYRLIRGTIDDLDHWMETLDPVLGKLTIGQGYQAFQVYQSLEPSARRLWKVLTWAQWVINPVAALAQRLSQKSGDRATQQLLVNLSQLLREALLRNLCHQAVLLYGGELRQPNLRQPLSPSLNPMLGGRQTQTLQEILAKAEPVSQLQEEPVNLWVVGRTGAGKSSLINTLLQTEAAIVDPLPSTQSIQPYHWSQDGQEALNLWDTPGYEQVQGESFRAQVLAQIGQGDVILLVTPALDAALQMDQDFLWELGQLGVECPRLVVMTQVDRLRPLREWQPPYDWRKGDRPKEKNIRDALTYRQENLGVREDQIFPLVARDGSLPREPWGDQALALAILNALTPAKQIRMARFLRNRQARAVAAAEIINRYSTQMSTFHGLTAFLKSPILHVLTTLSTGSPQLAHVLAEQIPVEQLPLVMGKLQMAYDLHGLLGPEDRARGLDLLKLWPLLRDHQGSPQQNAWALGHALVEYWSQGLSLEQGRSRFEFYLHTDH